MRLCAISFKECWQDEQGQWFSSGGFPLQMRAIGSLFDSMTLIITEGKRQSGGIPLPEGINIVIVSKPTGQDARRKLSVLRHLPEYISNISRHIREADVVHTPLPGDIPLIGMVIALLMRKRLIVRYCGSWFTNNQSTVMTRIMRFLMRIFAGGPNVMLATGDYPQPPGRNIHWIFASAISQAELENISPIKDHVLSSPPRIAYIGRLSHEKGVKILINAIGLMQIEGYKPMPTIILMGDGPQRKELEYLTENLGVKSYFIFKGQLDRQTLSRELLQVDFCVQPSLTEGYSKAWLDSFLHGLPILITDVGSARNVIGEDGDRGWIVPPDDVNALYKEIHHILTDHQIDWYALRKRCRNYSEGFTLDNWKIKIGIICAQQWKISLVDGKLRL